MTSSVVALRVGLGDRPGPQRVRRYLLQHNRIHPCLRGVPLQKSPQINKAYSTFASVF
ncbi:hypothetical protein AB0L97_38310 [Nocardia sp. NPDC051911]|uniref:hypothetical protein n=1 Tax=Nocardia sp. NPDC051911 TaxID=3154648 RepID=UPI0034450F15